MKLEINTFSKLLPAHVWKQFLFGIILKVRSFTGVNE